MNKTTIISSVAVLLLVTSMLPAATAQTNTLGIGTNDVGDEPQFPREENGFPNRDFSPDSSSLILESYAYPGEASVGYDLDNIRNRLLHGSSYDQYEYYMYPGSMNFRAYWGWWTDTGSGGSLQEDQVTQDDTYLGTDAVNTAQKGSPNGAIDDAEPDGADVSWDEFVWRGPNKGAQVHGQCLETEETGDGDDVYSYKECSEDEMFVFVQPGTHNMHANCIPGVDSQDGDCSLDNSTDKASQPDFIMEYAGQAWRQANGFGRWTYDQSLLMSSTVTTSVDPKETGDGLYQPEDAEAFDIDAFSAIDPAAEDLYRTAVWDPGNQETGPTDDTLHQEGPKEYLKEDAEGDIAKVVDEAFAPVNKVVSPAIGPENDAEGLAMTQWQPIRKHEPNTASDIYGIAPDGTREDWATFDSSTSYGGQPFYDPGANQDYIYDTEEHYWGESKAYMDGSINAVLFRAYGGDHQTVTSSPGQANGDHTQAPGTLYVAANVGTWYDANGDTWVGNVTDSHELQDTDTTQSDRSDPYASGVDEDPNSYGSSEFRGTCSADLKWVVEPTTDPDDDGKGNWGTAGVYVYRSWFNPYTTAVEDATGGAGADTTKPVRDQSWWVDYLVPGEDTDETAGQSGQLSRYVTEGAIEIGATCSSVEMGSGAWDPTEVIVFPTGSLEYDVKITFTSTLTDSERTAVSDAQNGGNSLTGEKIVDVDILRQIST